jgi:hypothetical protein
MIETPVPTQTKIAATRIPPPTLSAEAVDALLLELIKTNASCTLPCWWGVVPGISSADEARLLLRPFLGAVVSENTFESSEADGYYFMRPLPNGLQVGVEVLAKDKVVSLVYVRTKMTMGTYDLVYDNPFYQETMSAYTLEAVLTKYGKPDQILIRSFSYLAGEFNPTQILLFYPKEGIVAQYFSKNSLEQENETLFNLTCPPRSLISLRLFNPDSDMGLDELLEIDDSFPKYKDILNATGMDVDTFYQAFREYDENNLKSDCPAYIKTPWELWPSEYQNP